MQSSQHGREPASHTAVSINSEHEDLRHPSPAVRVIGGFSPRLIQTLRYLMHGDISGSDDSLIVDSDDDGTAIYRATGVTEPTAMCQICMEEVSLDVTVQLSGCAHRFCSACFTRFLTIKINDGQVNLSCFYENPDGVVCGAPILRSDVQNLVSPESFSKFERFQFNQQHSFARQCPHCEFSQLCAGPEHPQCVCGRCGLGFCYTHGNAHDAQMSCDQYDKKQLRMEKRNRRKIKRISRPCPSCKSPVEKNGGCNHMRCLTCSADFCWLCGEKLSEIIADHYDWTNVRGCAGQQMVHIHGLTTTNLCILFTARFTFYVIVYPIALVLTLIAAMLSCFFAICLARNDLTFVQVFRWVFRVVAIALYSMLEFAAVTIVTGFAAAVFAVCWCFHELYKLGKKSVKQCGVWWQRNCTLNCSRCELPWTRAKRMRQQVEVVTSPQVLVCEYRR